MRAIATEMDKRSTSIGRVMQQRQQEKESPSGTHDEQKGDDIDTTLLGSNPQAKASPSTTTKENMGVMFVRLWFSQTVGEN